MLKFAETLARVSSTRHKQGHTGTDEHFPIANILLILHL